MSERKRENERERTSAKMEGERKDKGLTGQVIYSMPYNNR